MGFFLETHNGECGLGKHICGQQRDHDQLEEGQEDQEDQEDEE